MARFHRLLKLAVGGMATVHVGYDAERDALVALKRPHPHLLADPGFLALLEREATIGGRIAHPSVVRTLGVFREDDVPLLVLEYVDGLALTEMVTSARQRGALLDRAIALRVVLDVAEGLHAAHETRDERGDYLGVVHRDVSPSNVIVGDDGRARVTDFGIAKCVEASEASATGLKGKLAYMAPEYVQARQIDRRVDVFALGVIAWELLAGRRLFRGATEPETLHRLLNEEAPPLAELDAALAPLDTVLQKALAKEPGARFQRRRLR